MNKPTSLFHLIDRMQRRYEAAGLAPTSADAMVTRTLEVALGRGR